ncbi:MAG TPA: decarboxylating 6-phosphogluconate dehydrogenase [Anaerolineales bacterium]|nr:decarboxylating 6-phosphogluconate dehydrogenase [Anaerolineales bacterium]
MQIAMIGLGRMGANMAGRLLEGGHTVYVWNRDASKAKPLVDQGAILLESIEAIGTAMRPPRVVWIMLPAGSVTEDAVHQIAGVMEPGDIIVDGGNSNYRESQRRAASLRPSGIHFVDAGTSGGIWGRTEGYSLMVGGEKNAVVVVEPALKTLAPGADRGWGHVGPSGAGHFVKMVHNGIEYGMMQAYAEGFEILAAKEDLELDVHQIAEVWRFGSVVRSWLLDLTANALADDPKLEAIQGWVADSGEGRWTVEEAIELDVPAPVISLALWMRFRSRQEQSYAARILAAMRQQFGGHAVRPTSGE